MGIRARLRLAPALAQATFTARMFICLHCDHTCLQKSLSFAPGVVVLHRLPLMPIATWSISHRSLDFVRIVKLTTPPAVSSRPVSLDFFCDSLGTGASACMVLLHVRRAKQAKTAFLRWSRCESGWALGGRTRNLSLRLLVPHVKRRKGPLPIEHSSYQTKTRQEWDVCKSPGFPSNCVAAGQVDPSAVPITMVCSLFACCLSASEAFLFLSGAVCWVFSNAYTEEEHLLVFSWLVIGEGPELLDEESRSWIAPLRRGSCRRRKSLSL